MKLWILLKVCDDPEMMGIYDSRQAAEIAATLPNHCVCGPVTLNETMPIGRKNWSNCFFPLAPDFRSPEIFRDGVQMFPEVERFNLKDVPPVLVSYAEEYGPIPVIVSRAGEQGHP